MKQILGLCFFETLLCVGKVLTLYSVKIAGKCSYGFQNLVKLGVQIINFKITKGRTVLTFSCKTSVFKWKAKNWSFAWKIENRPTYGDFEKKILDPQLHQIFKPIRKFFCTFLPIYQFKLRTPLKHIKVPKKYKTKKCITFFSLTHFTHSLHSLTHSLSQLTWGSRTVDATDDNWYVKSKEVKLRFFLCLCFPLFLLRFQKTKSRTCWKAYFIC